MMDNWVLSVRVEVKARTGFATIAEFPVTLPEIVENQKVVERDSVEKVMENPRAAEKDLGKTRLVEKATGKEAKPDQKEVVLNAEDLTLRRIARILEKPEVNVQTA